MINMSDTLWKLQIHVPPGVNLEFQFARGAGLDKHIASRRYQIFQDETFSAYNELFIGFFTPRVR